MKRTTYIFIGILVSVLVILMAGVVYISFQKCLHHDFFQRVFGS